MPPASEIRPLAKASNAFAFEAYAKLRSGDGNLAMSPASISSAAAMTFGGARARTAEEMRKVFHFTGAPPAVMTRWGTLQRALGSPDRSIVLNVANRLFGAKGLAFQQGYLDQTREAFGAELERLDFQHAADASTKRINAWVEQQTHDRIRNLIPMPVGADTRLVLVNAIYFLAKWAEPFQKQATREGDFTLASGTKTKAKMMHRRSTFRYARVPGGALLELPYKDQLASMVILLPDHPNGLPALEATLDAAKLEQWRAHATSTIVAVTLPKFEIETPSISLGKMLQALGMPTAFDPARANFDGIAPSPDPKNRLHIDDAIHKAFVKVDEEGTEAAAATAMMFGGGAGRPPKATEFVADHPFFFAIVDQASGMILFDGRLAIP
jgi:serpin B